MHQLLYPAHATKFYYSFLTNTLKTMSIYSRFALNKDKSKILKFYVWKLKKIFIKNRKLKNMNYGINKTDDWS